MNTKNPLSYALAAALGALCAYGVELLIPVLVLVGVMLVDYATGMAKAWAAGELCSRTGIAGILKKVGYMVIVAVACVVDWLLRYLATEFGWDIGIEFLFASAVIVWLIVNELISILENVAQLGAPVPAFLGKIMARLKLGVETKAGEAAGDDEKKEGVS